MKPGSVLVNVARGEIIDEDALADAWRAIVCVASSLTSTRASSSALPWRGFGPTPGSLITPHISNVSDHDRHGAIDVFCENLRAYLDGRPLRNVIDWERGY